MSTIDEKQFPTSFSGLGSTAITASVFIVVSLVLENTLRGLRRYPVEDARRAAGSKPAPPDRGMEGWAMGYLFRARVYVPVNPSPDYSKWPLTWIWDAIKLRESFFEAHTGPDATVYVRFLRGSFWWLFFMLCTVFPILTSINFIYSPTDVLTSSITRASITSLIKSDRGRPLLWVYVICMWLVTFTWFGMLFWLGYGAIRIRRNVLRGLLRASTEAGQSDWPAAGLDASPADTHPSDVGWRYRTVLVRNIPESMRSVNVLQEYFESHLGGAGRSSYEKGEEKAVVRSEGAEGKEGAPLPPRPLISDIVLVRKQNELNEQWVKYNDTLGQLESAHVALAENVMAWVKARVRAEEEHAANGGTGPAPEQLKGLSGWWKKLRKGKQEKVNEQVQIVKEGDEVLLAALRKFVKPKGGELTPSSEKEDENGPESLWAALHSLDPIYLDRFQPLFKLKHFRGQAVPAIDYHVTKLNLIQRVIEEHRSRPEAVEAASTAFITFSHVSDARRARKELKNRPRHKFLTAKAFECKTEWAPEVRDLDWNRLVHISLSSDIVRGIIMQTLIWAATIFWVIPISALVGLLNLGNIAKYLPKVATFLENNSVLNSLFSNLIPTSIVALLGMLVPTLIGILTRKFQTYITESRLLQEVQARYWKWTMFNIILVFCVTKTAFTAFFDAFRSPGSILTTIAGAFPTSATFYVSWSLLVIGIHHGVQHALLGIPYINHGTIRKLKSPRKREFESQPRFFSYHYWVPNHLLVLAVTFIFAALNPMVIPFNFAYFSFAFVVFKNQFAHVYYRRHFELNGRLVFRRIFRYSLDSLVVAQAIAIAFLEVNRSVKSGGATIPLIPVTVFVKLIGTRYFDMLMDEIDEVEADIICGQHSAGVDLSVPLADEDTSFRKRTIPDAIRTFRTFATTTLPAVALRPSARLPSISMPDHKADNHAREPSGQSMLSRFAQPRKATSAEMMRPILHARSIDSGEERLAVGGAKGPLHVDELANSAGTVTPSHAPVGLLTPHPPVIRDDRPVSHLHYDNPALVLPLARALWLPRDPLLPVDLGDTVNYHGRVLTSSEGGRRIVGTWDEDLTIEDHAFTVVQPAEDLTTPEAPNDPSPTSKILALYQTHQGTERIRVASDVAARVEEEEEQSSSNSRRRSSTALSGGSGTFPPMPRRGTGESRLSSTGGSIVLSSSPQPSPSLEPHSIPTFRHHPLEDRPGGPAIPSFLPDGSALSSSPPPQSRSATLENADSLHGTAVSSRDRIPPATNSLIVPPSPSHSQIAPSPRFSSHITPRDRSFSGSSAPRSPGRTTRQFRSPSHAGSNMRMSIAEGDETEVVEISQAAALRSEILKEMQEDHDKRMEKESKRAEQEQKDKKAGWFARLIVGDADNNAVPEGDRAGGEEAGEAR